MLGNVYIAIHWGGPEGTDLQRCIVEHRAYHGELISFKDRISLISRQPEAPAQVISQCYLKGTAVMT